MGRWGFWRLRVSLTKLFIVAWYAYQQVIFCGDIQVTLKSYLYPSSYPSISLPSKGCEEAAVIGQCRSQCVCSSMVWHTGYWPTSTLTFTCMGKRVAHTSDISMCACVYLLILLIGLTKHLDKVLDCEAAFCPHYPLPTSDPWYSTRGYSRSCKDFVKF